MSKEKAINTNKKVKFINEHFEEYHDNLLSKYKIDCIIKFLKESDKIYSEFIPPIIMNMLDLKDVLLPIFEKLSEELHEKLLKFQGNDR